jgi:adenine-specific DNA methylase
MESKASWEHKKNGIYYTPPVLAEYLAKPLIQKNRVTVFDPAYGEGALLFAASSVYKKLFPSGDGGISFFGCDKLRTDDGLITLGNTRLRKIDFFRYPEKYKFDVILMNPPYVRHHTLRKGQKRKHDSLLHKLATNIRLPSTADLWAYFLVKAVQHLTPHGSVGAILPWSFLQADYSRELRKWLASMFGQISILALGGKYFENAKERVILAWMKDYGGACDTIQMAVTKKIEEETIFSDLTLSQWQAERVVFPTEDDIDCILEKYVNTYSFVRFGECADVKIGVVTGADKYFILENDRIVDLQVEPTDVIPILTTSKELNGMFLNGNSHSKNLLLLTKENRRSYRQYIEEGKNLKYHKRSHSLRRRPWYAVRAGRTPDAFFPYRMSRLPYLVLNDAKLQCTNSIHRIYFKKLTELEIKSIQISLVSAIGQLSLERESKIYGKGILKTEPRSLRNSIVYLKGGGNIEKAYSTIHSALVAGDNEGAMVFATEWLNRTAGIPKVLATATERALKELQSRRLNR